MFYSYDILHPRKGKLAVVWLAATGRLQFQKRQDRNFREAMNVIIHRACDEILRYVVLKKVKAVSDHKGRFSLYLSSMLMYGTVKLYRRQIRFLLDEIVSTFEKLQRQEILLLNLDTSATGQLRVTLREPAMTGDVTDIDWSFPLLPLEPVVDVSAYTPRKWERKNTPSTPEIEMLRSETIVDGPGDATAQVLLVDWLETPTKVHLQDITLREQYLSTMSTQPIAPQVLDMLEEQALGPIDLGPPFLLEGPLAELPADPTLESVAQRLELDDQDRADKEKDEKKHDEEHGLPSSDKEKASDKEEASQQPLIQQDPEKQTDQAGGLPEGVIPQVEETPSGQQTVPQAELKRKGSAPNTVAEETPVLPQGRAPDLPRDTSQIHLEPVSGIPSKRPRTQRKARVRRLVIDQILQISREGIREQAMSTGDIMRHQIASQDAVHVHWWQKVIPARQLLTKVTHRTCLGRPINNLISRHYSAHSQLEHWDFQQPVRRQLILPDDSVEHARLGLSAVGEETFVLQDASSLLSSNLESSRTSGSRSLLQTPNVSQLEPHMQEPMQLLPIQEEQIDTELQNVAVETALPSVEQPQIERGDQLQPTEQPLTQLPDITITHSEMPPEKLLEEKDGAPKTRQTAQEKIQHKMPRRIEEDIRPATPTQMHPPSMRSQWIPPASPSPCRPFMSPQTSHEVVTIQADIHQPPAHIERSMEVVAPSMEALEVFPLPATGEFEVHSEIPPSHPDETFIREVQEGPLDIPVTRRPPGPVPGEELFIPSTVTPIKQPSDIPRVIETPDPLLLIRLDAENQVLNAIDKDTSGIQLKLTDLLPENPSRKHVANVFSTLLELHKKGSISLSQERNYEPIFIERL